MSFGALADAHDHNGNVLVGISDGYEPRGRLTQTDFFALGQTIEIAG